MCEEMQDGRWTPGCFQDSNNYGYINWWKTKHENALQLDKSEEKKLEVFCCLHDPLGCADELDKDLKNYWDEMNAIILALHSGIDAKDVKNKVIKGGKNIHDLIEDKNKALQIEGLIKSATSGVFRTSCKKTRSKSNVECSKPRNSRSNRRKGIKKSKVIRWNWGYFRRNR
ncbi:hypothetical protein JCM21142_41675 [Saccharicrinis fermentans DSM 9555 = JCM 21142]|uniref:Uncharacterized protein n=1 Tax=Saccharicrinis fermentans DSM 9555 = JCM 21142 TaxID=869213 RepID=W7Y4J4_9BACT|nr:hypothetical protein JCM21142_41675 [Saccharicrinis fermentans DSM 9555 = JCM 21142]